MLKQIPAVVIMNMRSLPQRLGSSSVIVIGIAGVVGVLVSVLTIASSLSGTLLASGRMDRAIVMTLGANSEPASMFAIQDVQTIIDAPGIRVTPGGDVAASADMWASINLPRQSNGSLAGVSVRGVSPEFSFVRPEIVIAEGRSFQAGLHEVIVGRSAQTEFAGLDVGDRIQLRGSQWDVVGIFESGDAFESGMLTDTDTLMSAHQRSVVNSVTVLLESPEVFDSFKASITTNPSLELDVVREPDYYARQSENVSQLLSFVTTVVAAIMTVGAVFSALNTMYAAVGSRLTEIATLRAIGFSPVSVVLAVLFEAQGLALIGGLSGAAIASLLFNGNTISLGGALGSVVTQLQVSPEMLGLGVALACGIGLVGGSLPAVRAARLPVATALRSA